MLRIAEQALEAIQKHAESGYPLEICGFLVGSASDDTRDAREAWPVRNAWEEDPEQRAQLVAGLEAAGGASADRWESADTERRFLVSPADTVAMMKRARQEGMDLIGLYHTHPNHPAIPSDFDRDAAWPDWSYLIVSVREGKVAEERSWVLEEEERQFQEEAITLYGGPVGQ